MVTPFGADGAIDEDAFVSLARHLLDEGGSDGAGGGRHHRRGLDDERRREVPPVGARGGRGGRRARDRGHRLQRHQAQRRADRARHRARAWTPCWWSPRTTTGPTGAGSWPTSRPSRRPPTCRWCSTTSRQRCVIDMPNDLLRELAEIDERRGGQAGPLRGAGADRGPRPRSPATTTCFPTCSTWAAAAGSWSPPTWSGARCAG